MNKRKGRKKLAKYWDPDLFCPLAVRHSTRAICRTTSFPAILARLFRRSMKRRFFHNIGPARGYVALVARLLPGAVTILKNGVILPDQSVPLVLGTSPSCAGSIAMAARSARANALNAASQTWWSFRPVAVIWAVIPAFVQRL